jgi:hypothetical protein
MSSILPEDEKDEYPTGFSIVGHVGKFTAAIFDTLHLVE